MIGLVRKQVVTEKSKMVNREETKKVRCINLEYLNHRTKSNPALMMEMIELYLQQTPPLINSMTRSLLEKDWETLHSTVHKMIPSFSIVGIHVDFETMAKKIQEFASAKQEESEIQIMVAQLEKVLAQACEELEEEFNKIKNTKNG